MSHLARLKGVLQDSSKQRIKKRLPPIATNANLPKQAVSKGTIKGPQSLNTKRKDKSPTILNEPKHDDPFQSPNYLIKTIKMIRNQNQRFSGERALEVLDNIKDKRPVGMEFTTISNLIFLETTETLSEKYKDGLRRLGLDTCYYEVQRLLRHGSYEQAALLAVSSYEQLLKKTAKLDPIKLSRQLHLFEILIEASSRNDTIICLQVLHLLSENHLLNNANYGNILANALKYKNAEILSAIYPYIASSVHITDKTWKDIVGVLLEHGITNNVPDIIAKTMSKEVKADICLMFLGSFEVNESFSMLESLISSKSLDCPSHESLPSGFRSVPHMEDFESIANYLEAFNSIQLQSVQRLFLYSLLTSINDQNVSLRSTIFMLNGLKAHHDLITSDHTDIVFNQLSKYSFKLTSIRLLRYFKSKGLAISQRNYLDVLKAQCHGKEIDTLYLVLVQTLCDHGHLSREIIDFLKDLYTHTKDSRIKYFLGDEIMLQEVKEKVNFAFISDNWEVKREREKSHQEIIEGFESYNYEMDIALMDSITF